MQCLGHARQASIDICSIISLQHFTLCELHVSVLILVYVALFRSIPLTTDSTTIPTPVGCRQGERACGDGQCIDSTLWCDRKYDCIDGTDEFVCGGW